jgi:L-alanine-DL-glutamate epimerase-like enolase superfamily enzyme
MDLLSDPPVRRVVCKPTVLGGLGETLRFAQALKQVGVEAVITTTLESAAGTWACAHLAAALNNALAHGLTTAEWFEENTGKVPEIRGDRIIMSTRPGLGFIPGLKDKHRGLPALFLWGHSDSL